MLRARPGNFRLKDFQPEGRPNLDWYNEYYQYQFTVWEDSKDFSGYLLPEDIKNAAGQPIVKINENTKLRNDPKVASQWYIESDNAKPPQFEASTTYLTERKEEILLLFSELSTIFHVVGHGLVYVADNMIHTVWGTNIAPIQEPGNPIPTGWFMFWPYYQRSAEDQSGIVISVPNRIKLKWYISETEQGTATYYYFGGIIGAEIPIEQLRLEQLNPDLQPDPPIQYLEVFGVDEGFYPEVIKYAREIARLDLIIDELTTTYALPIAIVASKVGRADQRGHLVSLDGMPVMTMQNTALQDVSVDAEPLVFAQADTSMIEALAAERLDQRKRMHRETRIPMEITENRDDQMSGVSRALLARPAVDRIETAHRQVLKVVDGAIKQITGSPLGEVEWPGNPFDTLAERRVVAKEMFEADLITLNEAREMIDLKPVEGGDKYKSEIGAERDAQSEGNNRQRNGNQPGQSRG